MQSLSEKVLFLKDYLHFWNCVTLMKVEVFFLFFPFCFHFKWGESDPLNYSEFVD
jgi:hypothetical protein